MRVTKKSVLTGDVHTREIPITEEQLREWTNGNLLIQQAFPQLSPNDREFLMTGVTPEEWEGAFGEDY
jgi:hypothetical protein